MFGSNAKMLLYFIDNLAELRKEQRAANEALREHGKDSRVYNEARERMKSYSGTTEQFRARMQNLVETMGRGAIPTVQWFQREVGKLSEGVNASPFWRAALGHATLGIGVTAELSKVTGPLLTLFGLYEVWRAKKSLDILIKAIPAGGPIPGGGVPKPGVPGPGVVPVPGPKQLLGPRGEPLLPSRPGGGGGALGGAIWAAFLDFLKAAGPKGLGIVGFLATPTVTGREWGPTGRAPWEYMEGGKYFTGPPRPKGLELVHETHVYLDSTEISAKVYDKVTRKAVRDSLR